MAFRDLDCPFYTPYSLSNAILESIFVTNKYYIDQLKAQMEGPQEASEPALCSSLDSKNDQSQTAWKCPKGTPGPLHWAYAIRQCSYTPLSIDVINEKHYIDPLDVPISRVLYQAIIHQAPPITDINTNVVNTPAPALSFPVMVSVERAGLDEEPDPPPAAGLPWLVPPVLFVTGMGT